MQPFEFIRPTFVFEAIIVLLLAIFYYIHLCKECILALSNMGYGKGGDIKTAGTGNVVLAKHG